MVDNWIGEGRGVVRDLISEWCSRDELDDQRGGDASMRLPLDLEVLNFVSEVRCFRASKSMKGFSFFRVTSKARALPWER